MIIRLLENETLDSFVSRFHFVSCSQSIKATKVTLFGSSKDYNDFWVSRRLINVADLIGGKGVEELNSILLNHTIFPIFSVLNGLSADFISGLLVSSDKSRLLRRFEHLPDFEMSNACISCGKNDLALAGYSYFHINHQVPGVKACHKHGEVLICSCPSCGRKFNKVNNLYLSRWFSCSCGWQVVEDGVPEPADSFDVSYSRFCNDLLRRHHLFDQVKLSDYLRGSLTGCCESSSVGLSKKISWLRRVSSSVGESAFERFFGLKIDSVDDDFFEGIEFGSDLKASLFVLFCILGNEEDFHKLVDLCAQLYDSELDDLRVFLESM